MVALRLVLIIALLTLVGLARGQSDSCRFGHTFTEDTLYSLHPQQLVHDLSLARPLQLRATRVIRQNIFANPRNRLYRKLNQWHTPTRVSTILSALPFQKGDSVNASVLAEAERLLRSRPYFYDARILIKTVCATTVDIDIVVREVWTLTPALSASREGGESDYQIGLADSNWRGTGRDVSFILEHHTEHTEFGIRFKDHDRPEQWLRSFTTEVSGNAHHYALALKKPFLTTNTAEARGFKIASTKERTRLYNRGREVAQFDTTTRMANLFLAHAGQDKHRINRFYFGLYYGAENLDEVRSGNALVFETQDRTFLYPYFAWESLSNNFVKLEHLQHLGRDEDISTGWNSVLRLGYSSRSIASSETSLHLEALLGRNWLVNDRHLFKAEVSSKGYYTLPGFKPKNRVTSMHTAYLHSLSSQSKIFTSFDFGHGKNLDHARFLEIGGERGMKGYANHFQTGTRMFRFLMEYRYETQVRPLNLFALGYAAFYEAGRAWFDNTPELWRRQDQADVLSNIGLGIRLHSLRTGSNRTIHIDLAKPLTGLGQQAGYEVSVTVRSGI